MKEVKTEEEDGEEGGREGEKEGGDGEERGMEGEKEEMVRREAWREKRGERWRRW